MSYNANQGMSISVSHAVMPTVLGELYIEAQQTPKLPEVVSTK